MKPKLTMFSRIREQFGTAGLIISVVALVFAMAGGAIAAKGGLTGKQKKEVKKIAKGEAKKFVGKQGMTGLAGPQGPKGDKGAVGAKGDTGAKGKDGTTGAAGVTGVVLV